MDRKWISKGVSKLLMVAAISATAPFAKANSSDLIQKADSAYLADDYRQAASLYLQAEKEDGISSALLYNIGNSYYRMGEVGKAILYYKRSLQVDPTNSDARQNLQFVMTKTVDKQDDTRSVMKKTGDRILFSNSPNGWAMWALGLFIVLIGAAAMYVFSTSVAVRKICFFGGIVVILLDGILVYVACKSASIVADESAAVVISPNVQLSTVPRIPKDKSEQAFQLHEGAVVEIVDSVKQTSDSVPTMWLEVKVGDDHRAWIKGSDVERL